MYEFGIYNITTCENEVVFGYNFADACRRAKLNPQEWKVEYMEYID